MRSPVPRCAPSFAAAVNREDLRRGASELGVDFDEHLAVVIEALTDRRQELMSVDDEAASEAG